MMPTESGAPIVIHLVHGTKPVKPGDPGVNPNDDKYKEMFTTVTRKIYQTKPNAAEQLSTPRKFTLVGTESKT